VSRPRNSYRLCFHPLFALMSVLYALADQATKCIGRLGVSASVDVQVTLHCDTY
jgi:hypothetical protein